MKKDKVVLAYSGGFDTSYCIIYLSEELQMDVYAICINTGGFSQEHEKEMVQKAMDLGAAHSECINAIQTYYDQCIRYLIYGNVLRNHTYPLSVSSERMLQALEITKYAEKIGTKNIAHGSTGAGNDQIRFDLVFETMIPGVNIITPIRDQELSREEEIAYLKRHGVNLSWEKAKYSINKGLWGTSVGGAETLTSHQPLPEAAFPSQCYKSGEEEVILTFDKGEPKAINGKSADPVSVIQTLEQHASAFAIGRDTHVGDTIIGIKGRIGFEAAAATIIIKAHQLLEKHVLSKWQYHWKDQLANWYGMMIHEGEFFDPVLRDMEAFFENSQTNVSGDVIITLLPYRFILQGIQSKNDLMNSDYGQYGEKTKEWSGNDARGFTKILANKYKIQRAVNGKGELGGW